ncbi:MAG: succinylglutamate desuccinylase/aspartoacylase family protein [Planctomycetota bacterium]|nr:succinylglutamate desuccinylase/aspartoacylase family protein [Planctomycetota bacterium]
MLKQKRKATGLQPVPLTDQEPGTRRDFLLPIYQGAMGTSVDCPFIVLRGAKPGPVVGISAAIHGNELNGINIIHQLLEGIDPTELKGTILFAPVANVPAFEAEQRRFPVDGKDLNTVFPGKRGGTPSQQYALAFKKLFLPKLDHLVDIHTASEGRINSMYARVDWHSKQARALAEVLQPQIILHGRSGDGTLRNAARVVGAAAVTLEAGNPSEFQGHMASDGEIGILRLLHSLDMLHADIPPRLEREPVLCKSSSWLRTEAGGILELLFGLTDHVTRGQLLARLKNPFGEVVAKYVAPHDGVVIGMTRTPIAVPGTRYCHLGVAGKPPAPKPKAAAPKP